MTEIPTNITESTSLYDWKLESSIPSITGLVVELDPPGEEGFAIVRHTIKTRVDITDEPPNIAGGTAVESGPTQSSQMRESLRLTGYRIGAVILFGGAVTVAAILRSEITTSRPGTVQPTEQTKKPATGFPEQGFSPAGGLQCDTKKVTVKPGDTVFGLTTVGLDDDSFLTDRVFEDNLQFLATQAGSNPALSNPNNLTVGETFSIHTDCIYWGQNYSQDIDNSNGQPAGQQISERWADYQIYQAPNGTKHDDVEVFYNTSTNGTIESAYYCQAAIGNCEDYVPGIPKNLNDQYAGFKG